MSLKTKVKVGNITNLSDARYCAGMGVDWLGFPIESVNPKTFAEITSWVTGPQFMIELKAGTVPESLYEYGVELIQVDSDLLSTQPAPGRVRVHLAPGRPAGGVRGQRPGLPDRRGHRPDNPGDAPGRRPRPRPAAGGVRDLAGRQAGGVRPPAAGRDEFE